MVARAVPEVVKQHDVDCVIANVENTANGSGLTESLYQKLRNYGVNLMTMGDHIYRKAELLPILENSDCIVRPVNYPPESVGKDFAIYQTARGPKVAVLSVMGRLFMRPPCDCPFHAVDRVLASPHSGHLLKSWNRTLQALRLRPIISYGRHSLTAL